LFIPTLAPWFRGKCAGEIIVKCNQVVVRIPAYCQRVNNAVEYEAVIPVVSSNCRNEFDYAQKVMQDQCENFSAFFNDYRFVANDCVEMRIANKPDCVFWFDRFFVETIRSKLWSWREKEAFVCTETHPGNLISLEYYVYTLRWLGVSSELCPSINAEILAQPVNGNKLDFRACNILKSCVGCSTLLEALSKQHKPEPPPAFSVIRQIEAMNKMHVTTSSVDANLNAGETATVVAEKALQVENDVVAQAVATASLIVKQRLAEGQSVYETPVKPVSSIGRSMFGAAATTCNNNNNNNSSSSSSSSSSSNECLRTWMTEGIARVNIGDLTPLNFPTTTTLNNDAAASVTREASVQLEDIDERDERDEDYAIVANHNNNTNTNELPQPQSLLMQRKATVRDGHFQIAPVAAGAEMSYQRETQRILLHEFNAAATSAILTNVKPSFDLQKSKDSNQSNA
jgi:hypothetical protein